MLHEGAVLVEQFQLDIAQVLPVCLQYAAVGSRFQLYRFTRGLDFEMRHGVSAIHTLCLNSARSERQVPNDGVVRIIFCFLHSHFVSVHVENHFLTIGDGVHFHHQSFVTGWEVPNACHAWPLPQVASVVDVETLVLHGDADQWFVFVPHGSMESSSWLFNHVDVEESRRPSMTWPACFADIIHARPKESSCNPFVLFDDVPRIVGVVGTDIPFRSTEIRQFLSHQELAFREFLMVGKHSCFEVVVTHHVGYS